MEDKTENLITIPVSIDRDLLWSSTFGGGWEYSSWWVGLKYGVGGDWDTIGGLMFHLLGHVPFEGESATEGEFRLRAEQVKGRRIGMVRIERLPQ